MTQAFLARIVKEVPLIAVGQELWAVQPLRYVSSFHQKVVVQEITCRSSEGVPLAVNVVIKASMKSYLEERDRRWLQAMPVTRLFETEYEVRQASAGRCLYVAMRTLRGWRRPGRSGLFERDELDQMCLNGLIEKAERLFLDNERLDRAVEKLFDPDPEDGNAHFYKADERHDDDEDDGRGDEWKRG